MDDLDPFIKQLSMDCTVKPAPRPWKLSLTWLGYALAYLIIALLISGVRVDLSSVLLQPWFVGELLGLVALIVSCAISAALLAYPDIHQQARLAALPLWIFAAFTLFMLAAWLLQPEAPLPIHSYECCLSIFALATLPTIAIFYAMRQLASTHPQQSGIAAAIFAFAIGALWLRLYEVTDAIQHVLLWHYLPMLFVAGLGAFLGKKMLRW